MEERRIKDIMIIKKLLCTSAEAALEAAIAAAGYASIGGGFQPEEPKCLESYRAEHTSNLKALFNKFIK